MNNSQLAIERVHLSLEEPVSNIPLKREEITRLQRIIGALEAVQNTKEWSTLKKELFDGQIEWLTKALLDESKKSNPDTNRLNRLSGELRWAEYYGDFDKLSSIFRVQLLSLKKQTNGTTEE